MLNEDDVVSHDAEIDAWKRDQLLREYVMELLTPAEENVLEGRLASDPSLRSRLAEVRSSLERPLPTAIIDYLDRSGSDVDRDPFSRHSESLRDDLLPSRFGTERARSEGPGDWSESDRELRSASGIARRFDRSTATLRNQIDRLIGDASRFCYVTNFFGARRKSSFQIGYTNDLKFYELERITERLVFALERGETFECVLVVQDFQAFPDLIVSRMMLRQDDKFRHDRLSEILRFVAEEISTATSVLVELAEMCTRSATVRFELRATQALIAVPSACSDEGAATGMYLANLSDYAGPVSTHEPGSEAFAMVRDHCDIYRRDSIQILGDSPALRATSFLELARDRESLFRHLDDRIAHDPVLFSAHYRDDRYLLGPES